MSKQISSGILLYRFKQSDDLFPFESSKSLQVLLVHPGGPFFVKKDLGFWSIPKGLVEENEDYKQAALREFKEEIGIELNNNLIELGCIKQAGGKIVFGYAIEGNLPEGFKPQSNMILIEWPFKSGNKIEIPENDKVEFFDIEIAKTKINKAQVEFLDNLEKLLNKEI